MTYEPINTRRATDYTLEDCARPPAPIHHKSGRLRRRCLRCSLPIEAGEPWISVRRVIQSDDLVFCTREQCAPRIVDAMEVQCLVWADSYCRRLESCPDINARVVLVACASGVEKLVRIAERGDAHLVGRYEAERLVALLNEWAAVLRQKSEEAALTPHTGLLLAAAAKAWPKTLRLQWHGQSPTEERS